MLSQVYKKEGMRGFFRGYSTLVMMRAVGLPFYFGGYECSKGMYNAYFQTNKLSALGALISGGIAGIVFWSANYPFDLVKARIQTARGEQAAMSALDHAKQIWREGGFRGFYRGVTPCLVRAFPANAVFFLGYQQMREALSNA